MACSTEGFWCQYPPPLPHRNSTALATPQITDPGKSQIRMRMLVLRDYFVVTLILHVSKKTNLYRH